MIAPSPHRRKPVLMAPPCDCRGEAISFRGLVAAVPSSVDGSALGQNFACRSPWRRGASPSDSRRNRRSAEVGSPVPTAEVNCPAACQPTARQSSARLEFRLATAFYDRTVDALWFGPAAGKITGSTVRADGFDILRSGNVFDSKMTVVNSPCQQSLTIVLEEGLPVKKLVATLKKC